MYLYHSGLFSQALTAPVPVKHPKRIWVKHVDLNQNQTPQYANLNILRSIQNGGNFADGHFKCICLNENVWISIKISLNFVPKVRINNIPALVQIMAWHRPGDRPLSGPMIFLSYWCIYASLSLNELNAIFRYIALACHHSNKSQTLDLTWPKYFWLPYFQNYIKLCLNPLA